ncbi:hypothetical protein Tco_0541331 [Tanacetum coccineum]
MRFFFSEEVDVLKREIGIKQYEINTLKTEFEKVKQEKDAIDLKIEKFGNASKDLDQLLESQITDKSKKGLGYSAVPPPHPLIYNRPNKLDLSYSGLEEFQQPEFEVYGLRANKSPRGNQRNWNNLKSQQLGSDFVMNNKACFVCGSFDHLKKDCGKRIIKPVWKNTRRVNDHYSTRMTHSNPRRNMIPQAVLMRSGIKAVNTAKPKDAHNAVKRNRFNAVKASACWVWMPKNRVVDHVSKNISASVTLKRLDYIDAQGRFKSVMAWIDAQAQGGQGVHTKKTKNPENMCTQKSVKDVTSIGICTDGIYGGHDLEEKDVNVILDHYRLAVTTVGFVYKVNAVKEDYCSLDIVSADSGFELIAYSDEDHTGCNDDCKSTSGGIQFLGDKLVSWSSKKQDCTAIPTWLINSLQLLTCFPKIQFIGRCNNYVVLQSIPCSPECKIVGQILLDHPLSYALTATVEVLIVYLQQFWKTVSKVCDTKDTIKFKLDTQEITYTADMFRHTLHLPVETPGLRHPDAFLRSLWLTRGSPVQGQRTHVNYDALFWWDFINCVFQKKDVIQYLCFTKLIVTDLMKKFPSIPQRIDEDYYSIKDDIPLFREEKEANRWRDKFTKKIAQSNHQTKTGGRRIEPGSHKEHPEVVNDDDDENEEEKKDEKKDDEMGSLENRTEKMQTPIPTTPRSHRINLSLDKNIFQELTDNVSLSTATTFKDPHKKDVFPAIRGKVDQVLHEILPQLAERATNDLIEGNLKRVVADTVIQERDAFQSKLPTLFSNEFDA